MLKRPNRRKKVRRQASPEADERRKKEQRKNERRQQARLEAAVATKDRRQKSRRAGQAPKTVPRETLRRVDDLLAHPGKQVFAIVRRAQTGDVPSRQQLVELFLKLLMTVVWDFAKSQEKFDDLLPEAVIFFGSAAQNFKKIPPLGDDDPEGRFKNSVMVTVRRRLEEHCEKHSSVIITGRGKKIKKAFDVGLDLPGGRQLVAEGSDPLSLLLKAREGESADRLIPFLAKLDPREQVMVRRHKLAEPPETLKNIGESLGIGEKIAGKIYRRALKKLRTMATRRRIELTNAKPAKTEPAKPA